MKKFLTQFVIVLMLCMFAFAPLGVSAQESDGSSGLAWGSKALLYLPTKFIELSGEATLRTIGFFTWLSSEFLNITVDFSVINMKKHIDGEVVDGTRDENGVRGANVALSKGISAIDIGWRGFRDIANLSFIFIILFIAIGVIIGNENYNAKTIIKRLIIVALLINFSLFFTKAVIDSSNILAIEFYNKSGIESQGVGGFSGMIMGATKIATIYDIKKGGASKNIAGEADVSAAIANPIELFVMMMMGSVFLLVLTFIFVAAGVFFLMRFVSLVFLMVLSPLAFVAYILPTTSNITTKWWSLLLKNAFFAPAFFILLWFVMNVVNSPGFAAMSGFVEGQSIAQLITGNSVGVAMNFVLVSAFLIYSLHLANSMSIGGAKGAITIANKAGNKMRGFVGRNTVGLAARGVGAGYNAVATRAPAFGRSLRDGAGGLAMRVPGVATAVRVAGAARDSVANAADSNTASPKRTAARAARATAEGLGGAVAGAPGAVVRGVDQVVAGTLKDIGDGGFGGDTRAQAEAGARRRREEISSQEQAAALSSAGGVLDVSTATLASETARPGTTAQIKAAQDAKDNAEKAVADIVVKLSGKEIAGTKDTKGMKTEDIVKISQFLSDPQMEAIDKSDMSDIDKKKIKDARDKPLTDGMETLEDALANLDATITSGASAAAVDIARGQVGVAENNVKDTIAGMSKKRKEKLSPEQLEQMSDIEIMGQSEFDSLMKSDILPATKKKMKEARTKKLVDASGDGKDASGASIPENPKEVERLMGPNGIKPKDFAKAASEDMKKNIEIVMNYTPNHLAAMVDEGIVMPDVVAAVEGILKRTDRATILTTEQEKNYVNIGKWTSTGAGQALFG